MRSNVKISVIVPTFRRTSLLRDLLGSLERQICEVPFEVIVVANLPEKDLKKMVLSFGNRFRFFETGRINSSIAKNKGIERSTGTILLFLDDDCYLQSRDVLQRHWELHETHVDAVAIGGRYSLKPDARDFERAYHWITDLRLTRARRDGSAAVDLPGGNCSFKKKLLGKLLHFDEALPARGAETSLFNQLSRSNYKILGFDELTVEHRLQTGRWDISKKGFQAGYTESRIDATEKRSQVLHWNSMLTFEQNLLMNGASDSSAQNGDLGQEAIELAPYVASYNRAVEFGRLIGSRLPSSGGTLPSLRWQEYWLHSILCKIKKGSESLFNRAYLLIDRSLSLSRDPSRDPH